MITVACPAKVNLHLEVLARRPDGFHELRTIFQAIDLWDHLEAAAASDLSLVCDDPALPSGDDNIVMKAARALRRVAGDRAPGARMVLRKGIPTGGGLGGGSSDAAGALVALARLWDLPGDPASLTPLAAGLGSDVVFFLHGGTAAGSGRGEIVQPLPYLGARPLVLGFPAYGIATAEVYRRLAARRSAPEGPLTPPAGDVTVPALLTKFARENDFGAARNDLEEVVLEGWPQLKAFRARLVEAGARLALVSGSGSTVFGLFDEDVRAVSAARVLAETFPDWRVAASRTVSAGVTPVGV